jgi:hypothetical protein
MFFRGIGADGLTKISTWPFGSTPSNPKPSILQRLRNLASLSRPLPARREASGQPNFVASGRLVDTLQDELEIEGQLEFSDHDDRKIVSLQGDKIAVPNLALDDKAEPFEEDLDRPIKGRLQNRSHV